MSDNRSNVRVAYFNGRIVPEREVVIPFRDRGFKYGDAAFDMTRTFHGRAFKLTEHVDRLYRSLKYLRIDPGLSPGEMVAASEEVLARNAHFLTDGHRFLDRPAGVARGRRGRRRGLGGNRPDRHRRVHPAAAQGAGAALPRRHRHHRAADPPHGARSAEPAGQDSQLSQFDNRRSSSKSSRPGGVVGAARPQRATSPRASAATSSWCATARC